MVWRYRPEPRRLHRRRRVATLPGADCLGELSRRDSRRRPRGCYWEPRALEIPQGSAEYIVAAVISRRDLSSARWSLYELEPREWVRCTSRRVSLAHSGAIGLRRSPPMTRSFWQAKTGKSLCCVPPRNGRFSPSTASTRTSSPRLRFSIDGSTSAPATHSTVSQSRVFEFSHLAGPCAI